MIMIDCQKDFLERRIIGLNAAAKYERLSLWERVDALSELALYCQSLNIHDWRKAKQIREQILRYGIGRDKVVSLFGRN